MSQATLKAFLLNNLFCPGVKIQPFVYTLALQLFFFVQMWIHILVLLLVLFSLFSYSCNKKLTTWNFLSCSVLSIMTQTTEYTKLKIILLPSKSKSINAIACQLKEEKVRITCQTIANQLVGKLPRHKVISHRTPVSPTSCLNISDNITQG